tara:strand:+ start:163 stop:501 length:339 start_codon:yes stop_codon:yes gene_type:complete
MTVYVANIVINGGADFNQTYDLADQNTNAAKDLTNHTVASQMRKHAAAVGVTTFTTTIVNPTAGQVRIGLTTSQTSELEPGRYVYDLMLTAPDNSMTRIIEGMALVREGVTK